MIKIDHLKKIYKLTKRQMQKEKTKDTLKIAVKDISFEAQNGQIFGLLGPNGAGKTTTLRCIATLLKPTEGNITVQGYDTITQSVEVRKRICFLTNELKLDPHFTPKYTMNYFGKLYNLSDEQITKSRNKLFNKFKITEYEDMKISELSTGMKQKLSIAVSLVHDPEVIIFDEPTSGLDIITSKIVTDYLKELRDQGKLVIISTHIMSVAEKLCDTIAIIINGNLVTIGDLNQILVSTNTNDLEEAFFELYKQHSKEAE